MYNTEDINMIFDFGSFEMKVGAVCKSDPDWDPQADW